MKNIAMKNLLQRLSSLLLLVVFFVLASCQKEELPFPETTNPDGVQQVLLKAPPAPFCELPECSIAVAREKERLIRLGEGHCGAMVAAVPCCSDGQPTMMMVQYQTMCAAKQAPRGNFTGPSALEVNVLGIDVVRYECFAGGSSLAVVFRDSGTPIPIGPYLLHWWIDGQYIGSMPRLECAEGKSAWLLLLNMWEGQKYFFEIPLYSGTEDL